MGNTLKTQGKLEEAIEAYNKAIAIKPDFAEAYNNMGAALKAQGNLEEAIEACNKAIAIKPDFAEAYYNMGISFKEQGKLEEAIEAYTKAIVIKPDFARAYSNISISLKGLKFTKHNRVIQTTIISMLDRKTYVRPRDISRAAISLLKFEPSVKDAFEIYFSGALKQSLREVISNLSEVPLLLRLMSICPLDDLELETVLFDIRANLLSVIYELADFSTILRFQSALALQCYTNEYVYNHNDIEVKAVEELDTLVENLLYKGEQPTPQSILCLASYKGLTEYKWWKLLIVTTDIEKVYTRQVLEPNCENRLKLDIPALDEITNKVSEKVRDQYEKNPYPRWIYCGLPLNAAPTHNNIKALKLKLYNFKINEVEAPNILIAGCGTGEQAIDTASYFKNSKVLAVDLSSSSLAYAKRKTQELGVQNIEYMQADILALGKLNKKFDIIESAGVLHHMDNPMAGWRVLTNCLKSGGLMKIGLYSELARQDIVKMRKEISHSGIGSSDIAMKSFRTDIINSNKDHHKTERNSNDFYSLSTLRDLLFHVQEHRFTIPQIKNCLFELDLKFCGFQSKVNYQHFKQTNIEADDLYDLDKWQVYEEANPRAFAGMYQFWCQK